jgi:hypothetical protein
MEARERARYSMRRLALEHLRDRIQTSDTPTPP